jgi:gliding motility-associated-like protein
MKKTKLLTVLGLTLWCTTWFTTAWSQSSSFGNTYIFSQGNISIHGGNHSFLNAAAGVLPGTVGTARNNIGTLSFMPGTTWSNAANASHVDGYVRSYQPNLFIFPIGDNGVYRPAATSTASITTPVDAAYYGVDPSVAITSSLLGGNEPVLPTGGPFPITAKASSVEQVSNKEYWDINGTAAAKLTLTWNPASALATLTTNTMARITILGWDGTQWVDIASTVDAVSLLGGASTLSSGSITTDAALVPNMYAIYTLGSRCIPANAGTITGSPTVCLGSTAPLTLTGADTGGTWSSSNPAVATVDATGQVQALAAGTVTITYTVSNSPNCPSASSTFDIVVVTCDTDGDGVLDATEIADGTDPNDPCSAIMAHITETLSPTFLNSDCDGDGLTNEEELGPDATHPWDTNANGTPNYLEPNNHTVSEDDIEVFNLITPNGDGENDVLTIRNIELYPENSLDVFNRWGILVYGVDGYGQNGKLFRGFSEGRATVSQADGLPVGTYWYILRYKNAQGIWKERISYLYINK